MRATVALRRGVPAAALAAAAVLVPLNTTTGAGSGAPPADLVALAEADPAGVGARITDLERAAEESAARLGLAPRQPAALPATADGLATRLRAAERVGAFLASAREATPSRLPRTLPGREGASARVDAMRQSVRLGLRVAPAGTGWEDVTAWLAPRREALREEERPFAVPAKGSVTSLFGSRWGRAHEGVDVAGPSGSPIRAAASGRVVSAGTYYGYGLHVVIAHPDGLRTAYAHMSSLAVRAGKPVERGDVIGRMGASGNATGVHLHFEVHRGGVALDPLPYLPPLPLSPESGRTGVLIGTIGVPATWALTDGDTGAR